MLAYSFEHPVASWDRAMAYCFFERELHSCMRIIRNQWRLTLLLYGTDEITIEKYYTKKCVGEMCVFTAIDGFLALTFLECITLFHQIQNIWIRIRISRIITKYNIVFIVHWVGQLFCVWVVPTLILCSNIDIHFYFTDQPIECFKSHLLCTN